MSSVSLFLYHLIILSATMASSAELLNIEENSKKYWLYEVQPKNCSSYVPDILIESIKAKKEDNITNKEIIVPSQFVMKCLRDKDTWGTLFPYNVIDYAGDVAAKSVKGPVDLTYTFALNNLIDLGLDGTIIMKGTFNFYWENPYRKWNIIIDDDDDISFPHVASFKVTEIWHPVLLLSNCEDKNCFIKPDSETYVKISNTGSCELEFETIFSASCNTDLLEFPFDEQNCTIELYFQDARLRNYLNLVRGDISYLTTIFDSDEWEIIFINTSHKIKKEMAFVQLKNGTWKEIEDERSTERLGIIIDITCRRHPEYYIFNLIMPLFLIVFLGFVTLLLQPDENRLNLVVLLFVSFIYLQTLIAGIAPKTKSAPYLLNFIIAELVATCFNLVFLIIVMMFDNFGEDGPPPTFLIIIIIRPFNKLVLFLKCKTPCKKKAKIEPAPANPESSENPAIQGDSPTNSNTGEHVIEVKLDDNNSENSDNENETWKRFAYIIDWVFAILFVGFIIFSSIYYFFVPLLPPYNRYLQDDLWYIEMP